MSKDRLRELHANPSWSAINYTKLPQECVNHEDESQGQTTHHESCSVSIDNDQSHITDFLQEIETIETMIEKIHELSQHVKDFHVQMLEYPLSKLGQELDKKNNEINELSRECSKQLKRMEEAQGHSNDLNESNAHRRIRESQVFVLFRRFRDTMAEHHKESLAHRERCKTAIIRELDMTGQRRNTEELEELIENGCSGSLNFCTFIDIQKATQALDDVKARHIDFVKLESQIRELRGMFHDLVVLVAEQGEMMDRIEYNVEKAMDYVEVAAENVDTAEKYRKQAAARKRIIIIIIIIILAVILVLFFSGSLLSGKLLGR